MILNKQDSIHASNVFHEYFNGFKGIEDYMRRVKLERMSKFPTALPGMGPEDDMFTDFDMHPEDMDIVVQNAPTDYFNDLLEITTSAPISKSVPGKGVKLFVKEKNTNKIVGMIRFGSPTINSKPRNDFLGKPLDTQNADVMKRFNDSVIMGFAIVPTQPFGFNYMGGKLLAAICCSHLTKDLLDKKYGGPFCMFETTSLYGSSKTVSMYDGMKPFLRFKGLTESDFLPLINDENYLKLNDWFIEKNNGEPLVHKDASSRKLKSQTKMVGIIKNSLRKHDIKEYEKFEQTILKAKGLTERKRQFMSDYGYANVKEYLNLETDTLVKKENYDRYSFESVVDWWKNKASRRYASLKSDGRLRTQLETWNSNADDIDIIR